MSNDHWENVDHALKRNTDYDEEQPVGSDDDKWSNVMGLTRAAADRFEKWMDLSNDRRHDAAEE